MADIKNVMVVDDEQIVLDSVRKYLKREPYEVHTVMTAQEALDMLKKGKIDIVLTDLMMPEMDGLELMAVVRKKHPNTPIIMITGYATISTALQAMELGAFDYIAKPFTGAELRGIVKRAAELASASGEPGEQVVEETADEVGSIRAIGDNTWFMSEESGEILLGVEHPFLNTIGRIQTVYLPSKGDELRQGSVFFQVFTTDLRSHAVLSPLSGEVVDVNKLVATDPADALQDPYGEGWLIRLKPSKFEEERKLLGL